MANNILEILIMGLVAEVKKKLMINWLHVRYEVFPPFSFFSQNNVEP